MSPFLFWIFALLTVIFGAAVVINRNPVASALSLVVSFLGLAALFMSLNAYFIGIIQVLVYAGAVMVLFLFIIMLLDLRAEEASPDQLAGLSRRTRCRADLVGSDFFCGRSLYDCAHNAFPPLPGIDNRRCSEYRRGTLWELQSAISNRRRSGPGGNDWRRAFEQTRTSVV